MTLLEVLLALSLGALLLLGGFQLLCALTVFNHRQEAQWHQVRQGLQIAYSLRNLLNSPDLSVILISHNPTQIQITYQDLSHTTVYLQRPHQASLKSISALYWQHPNGYQSLWVHDVSRFDITGPLTHLILHLTLTHPDYSAQYWLTS